MNQHLIRKPSVILPETGERVHRSVTQLITPKVERTYSVQNKWLAHRNVIKCSLAYLLASLCVYIPYIDDLLGSTDSKHVIATVAVYFHPARSKGSMYQMLRYVAISITFSFSVSMASRMMSMTMFNRGNDEVSYGIDLATSSVALGIISMMKQKFPAANTACSLASICIVACIVKEGSLNTASIPLRRIESTFVVVVTGCAISVLVCYLVWPISAVDELRKHLNVSYDIMSDILHDVSVDFMKVEDKDKRQEERMEQIIEVEEERMEQREGQERMEQIEEERMEQMIEIQERMEQVKVDVKRNPVFELGDSDYGTFAKPKLPLEKTKSSLSGTKLSCNGLFQELNKNIRNLHNSTKEARFELLVKGREKEYEVFHELTEATISLAHHLQALRSSNQIRTKLLSDDTSETESIDSFRGMHDSLGSSKRMMQLFDVFVETLAPSMTSLIFTIQGIMSQVPFENQIEGRFAETTHLQSSLSEAIALYEVKQEESFELLYSRIQNDDDVEYLTDQEEVTACCGNFASILGLYAKGLLDFLRMVETYEPARRRPRSWGWIRGFTGRFWKRHEIPRNSSTLDAAILDFQSQFHHRPVNVGEPHTQKWSFESMRYELWKSLKVFRRNDVQFGVRVGLGAFVLSMFAFLPRTRVSFNSWRVEWALTVYCIMMNKSLGGTTMTVKWRIIGTGLGALSAYIAWEISDGNAFVLATTGLVISLVSFRIILYWSKNNPFGRFILLTYNLTAIYSYSMREQDNEDGGEGGNNPIVGEIAFHRFIAVSLGILWALIMASCFLPSSARARLKSGLTVLWLRMGVIWNSDPLGYDSESSALVGLKDEKGIEDLLAECEGLIKQAPLEFRLKGCFPEGTYRRLLDSTTVIIDAFQNMNLMIKVEPVLGPNERIVLSHIDQERQEVEHRIFLVFYMVASAMRLGFPIPRKPASTEHAKDRMLWKLAQFRRMGNSNLSNNDFILLYSYILVTTMISEELDVIISLLIDLLGDVSVDRLDLV